MPDRPVLGKHHFRCGLPKQNIDLFGQDLFRVAQLVQVNILESWLQLLFDHFIFVSFIIFRRLSWIAALIDEGGKRPVIRVVQPERLLEQVGLRVALVER